MDYIRDHCKSTAFDVIKSRADPISEDPYLTSDEMIQELYNMFGEFDKVAKANTELHDPKFGMGMKDSKESFDEFYARFATAVAPLGFNDVHKISNLKRLISKRLRWKVTDGTVTSSYR